VRPRGDQVRRTGGISETADSSKKTSQADSASAPFDPRPLLLHPAGDGLLVAFAGPPLGALQGPAEAMAQDHPDIAGVIADPSQLADHRRHPLQGPQVGIEPVGHRPRQQGLLDLGELGGRQLGVRTGRPPTAQGVHAALLEAGVPDMRALAGHAEGVGDLGLGVALGEQLGGLQASGLEGARCWAGSGRRVVGIAEPHTPPAHPSTQPTKLNKSAWWPMGHRLNGPRSCSRGRLQS
jgi:hypothetical protein